MKKVILCGKLFLGTSETDVLENVAVVVEGDRIECVCPISDACTEGAQVIDLSGKFVMPGLIDCHLHTSSDGKSNDFNGEYTLVGNVAFNSMRHAQQDLMAGFTTVRDEGSSDFVDVSLRNAINAGQIVGPRMLVSGLALGTTGGHCDSHYTPQHDHPANFIINSAEEARRMARYNVKYGVDQLKLMATGGVMSIGDAPGAQDMMYDEMKAAIDIAKIHGKLTSAHAHGAEGIKAAIRAGITSIEHGMLMDDECIELMVEHGTYLVPTIIAAYQIVAHGKEMHLPEENIEKATLCLEKHKEHLMACRAAGVKIAFGTDAGTPSNFHGEQTFEFKLMVDFGFRPAEALLCATKNAADLIRWSDRVGSVEVGKFADIIAMDGNPLEDITAIQHVNFVMKGGDVVKG